MSVKFSFARLSLHTQIDAFSDTPRSFLGVQVGLFGYSGGSNSRVKFFNSTANAMKYINKLHLGNWINDEEYHKAYTALDKLHYTMVEIEERGEKSCRASLEHSVGDTSYNIQIFGQKLSDPWMR